MITWLKHLWRGQKSPRSPRPSEFRPTLEMLEDRRVPAGNFLHSNLVNQQPHSSFSANSPILPNLSLASEQIVSTVPSNQDNNPYGVAFVPQGIKSGGMLAAGDVLVSNFNSSSGIQGTGSTIVSISPSGQQSVFFQGPTGLGLTTALGVLKSGFVIVGSLPNTTNGVQQGSLLFLDSNGNQVGQLSDSALLDGPWDMAINDQGNRAEIFISNVLSGTVTRIDLKIPNNGAPIVESETQIASGYTHMPSGSALEIGPTGLAYDPNTGVLYVASTGDNAIYAIRNAAFTNQDQGTGRLVVQDPAHLKGPLGLTLAPNGDLIAANGDAVNTSSTRANNELLEYTPQGRFVGEFQIDPGLAGAAFGVATSSINHREFEFAAVNDNTNQVDIWTFHVSGH